LNQQNSKDEKTGFSGIIGQNVPKRVLAHLSDTERLPGTLLFSGPGGIGKLATAVVLARRLHCREGFPDGCECDSCNAIRAGTHPDVIVLSRDKHIGVDEMREITALAGLRSAQGQERVIIIDRAENITTPAANAALKTLEEPGVHVRFILVTDTPSSLLPTVKSRAYKLRFTLLSSKNMSDFVERIGDDPDDRNTIAALKFAAGRPGWYLRLRLSDGYREVTEDINAWLAESTGSKAEHSLEAALEWKKQFWEFADRLSVAEKKTHLPRGGDVSDIVKFIESSKDNRIRPINWRADELVARESRWGQGRKALLLSDLMMRCNSGELNLGKIRKIENLRDFTQKIRFNCSFDIAIERLYFSIAGK